MVLQSVFPLLAIILFHVDLLGEKKEEEDGKGTILIELDVLMQERLLGVALGAAFAASVVLENRRAIHGSISDNRPAYYEVRWI